ncbi:hypothetical protein FRC18_005424 [Serendipita sp. 400]|nr:hypothetical protein FRC18_005424 [Serendipita sp. 400]
MSGSHLLRTFVVSHQAEQCSFLNVGCKFPRLSIYDSNGTWSITRDSNGEIDSIRNINSLFPICKDRREGWDRDPDRFLVEYSSIFCWDRCPSSLIQTKIENSTSCVKEVRKVKIADGNDCLGFKSSQKVKDHALW